MSAAVNVPAICAALTAAGLPVRVVRRLGTVERITLDIVTPDGQYVCDRDGQRMAPVFVGLIDERSVAEHVAAVRASLDAAGGVVPYSYHATLAVTPPRLTPHA